MSPEAGALNRVAASVADGSAVDWGHVEADVAPRERRLVPHLRLVESIASLYRSIPDLDETAVSALPSGARWGRLIKQEQIGYGTSADVHRAFDTDLHRSVALKLLHPDGSAAAGLERMLEEGRRLARVSHQHIVQVFGAEQHLDRVGLWMELVEGESLDHIVQTRGPFGAREAAGIGQDLCSALAAVHGAGLVHRDIKAQNVLREAGGRIVLMDFGTGEDLRAGGGQARLVGTPLYLAPELFQAQPASVQSDLYSLGVLLFYLVTREFPVSAATLETLKAAHGARQVRRLRDLRPNLPARFVEVVDRALEHDPAARYQSAGEMEAALRGATDRARATEPAVPPRPGPYSKRALAVGSIAAMFMLMVGLVAWVKLSNPTRLTAPPFTRVAVLPFKDLSPAPSPYLAAALTDQLVATLGQVQALRVTMADQEAGARAARLPPDQMASQLGVDAVVQSSVTADPSAPGAPLRARVESRISRAGVATPFSTGSIGWVAGDSRSLQAGLTRAIAKAVNAVVTPAEAGRIGAPAQTNPNAEDAYFRGRVELGAYGVEAGRNALRLFQQALTFDSRHAGAYAGASRAYIILGQGGAMSEPDARQSALAAARNALELDPDLAEAHRAVADLTFYFDWDWAAAEREYHKAIDLNPSLWEARMTYSELLSLLKRFPEALQQLDMARSVDPQSPSVNISTAMTLLYARDYAQGKSLIQQTLLQRPGFARTWVVSARFEEAERHYEQALASYDRATALSGGTMAVQIARLQLLARSGKAEEARDGLAALDTLAAARKVYVSHRDRGYVRLALGDAEGACDEFEQSLEARESQLIWIAVDPRVESLHGNPRFQAILKRMHL